MAGHKRVKPPRVIPERCMFQALRGRCSEPAGHGVFGNYCAEHAAYFAQIRADTKRSLSRTNNWGWDEGEAA